MSDLGQSRFTPGPGTAIVASGAVALVGAGSESPTCVAIESALAAGEGLERVMTALSALGFVELPAFVIAVAMADGVQLLHRGNLAAYVEDGNHDTKHFVAPRVTTWREEFIADAVSVRASIEDSESSGTHWVSAGVVPACSIEWSVPAEVIEQVSARDWEMARAVVPAKRPADAKSSQAPTPKSVLEDGPAIGASFDPPSPTIDTSPFLDSAPRPPEVEEDPPRVPAAPSVFGAVVVTSAAAEIEHGEPPVEPLPETPLQDAEAQPGHAAPVSPDPMESVGSAPAAHDVDFGNFLHHTVFRNAEDAAIRPTADDELDVPAPPEPKVVGSSSGETLAPEWTRHSANPPVADPSGGESGSNSSIISSIPLPGGPASAPAIEGDHDGHTVARPRRREGVPQGQRVQPGIAAHGQPMVSAVACALGHFSPPHAHQCRICEQAIVDRTQISIPRPALAVLRFSTNVVATVAGPLLIGRNPPGGQVIDNEVATILAIDNPELSRFHAAIYVSEWYVYIADQRSVNGTVIKVPGKDPQTLRPNERVQISQGTVVELGGAVDFRFDVA